VTKLGLSQTLAKIVFNGKIVGMAGDPNTVTMNVSLPEPLKQYVDRKVSSGVYGSASEFVREAIREKLHREQELADAKAALTRKLLQGLDSGKSIAFTDDYFKRKKRALVERARAKKKSA
jgi:antitoxin ParD1/3/4